MHPSEEISALLKVDTFSYIWCPFVPPYQIQLTKPSRFGQTDHQPHQL